MRTLMLPSFTQGVLAALVVFTGPGHAKLDAAGMARLRTLQQSPGSTGELIYRGTVFEQPAVATPLFTYERRVGRSADGWSAAHITHAPNGDVIIAEEARFTAAYALQRFDATHGQLGYSGTVVLSNGGRHLEYRLIDNGKAMTTSEDVADPVVSGPSLHGFILQHWEPLAQGRRIAVRMIVMAKMQTYGFEVRRVAQVDGRTSFAVTPSNWLVRLAVAPLTVTFDPATRNVLRYEGRVPPMRRHAGKFEPLDARVDYTMTAAAYR